MEPAERYGNLSWEFVCDEKDCPLHIPLPDGQSGEWAEVELGGVRIFLTWNVVNNRVICPRHTKGPAAVDPRQAAPEPRATEGR